MNRRISTIAGGAFLAIVASMIGGAILTKNNETDVYYKERQAEFSPDKNKFKSVLAPANEEIIFSIPEDSVIPASCFICEEKNIDLVEGQYWNFAVSSDYKNYAYSISENNKVRVVLNGEKKKMYDAIYLLRFNPVSKDFLYHAYDKDRDLTYLVYNDKEIIAYPEREGWPQAANGFREAFSDDGKHFAYSKIEKGDRVNIIVDGKIINTVKGLDASLINFDGDTVEYIINLRSEVGNSYDYNYYRGDKFIKTIDFTEFNEMQIKNSEAFQAEIKGDKLIKLDGKNKSVLVNGDEIINYRDNNPEVYLSHLKQDNLNKNFVYKVTTNIVKDDVWVSLNGKDSKNKYNDIFDINFSEDNKELIYTGRKGRNIYKVTHEIISSE